MAGRIIYLLTLLVALLPSIASAQFSENETRGFSPDKLYDFADIDAINTFNGNLTVTIPIGGRYPVNSTFSYGLTAVYNSQVWDFDEVFNGALGEFVGFPVASELWNAGLGWTIGFGRLFPPEPALTHQPINDTNQWLYIDPSGAKHHFYDELHANTPSDASPTTFYSRDNSYLRLKLDNVASPTSITVEFPDGRSWTFEEQGGEGWYPVRLEDAFGNNVDVDYQTADPPGGPTWVWTITDKHARTQTVDLVSDPELGYIVDEITLAAFDGEEAVYDFQYDVDFVETCYKREVGSGGSTTLPMPLLTAIVLPESAGTFDFTDAGGDAKYHKIGCASLPGGLLGMRLPTRGQIEWDYGGYLFPADRGGSSSLGVETRRTLDAAGALEGTWTYKAVPGVYNPEGPPDEDEFLEVHVHVTFPTSDCAVHYFSAEPAGPNAWKYGLPLSLYEPPADGLFLSTRFYETSDGSNECSGAVLRSTYVEYENDVDASGGIEGNLDLYNTNRRLLTSRTVYDDGFFAETALSDYDGVGHYRKTETDGDFPSGNAREIFATYNSTLGTYNPNNQDPDSPVDSFTPPTPADPWVLGTFDERRTTEGTTAKERFCFETSTGFLLWRRTLRGMNPGTNDVVSVFERGSSGNLIDEHHYGGDLAVAPATGACPLLSTPGGSTYHLRHLHADGVLRRTSYRTATGTSLGFFLVDRTIDPSTGLVATSKDTAQLETTFTYDRLGRLTRVQPEAGHGARTDYTYTAAMGSTPAQVTIGQKPNGGGVDLATSIVLFDGLGRLSGELRKLPSGGFNRRNTAYNSRGWKESVSELELGTPTHFTIFTDYDPFGRPGRIIAPDGNQVQLAYTGVSKVERTVSVSGSPSTTTEEFDRQGRLWRVTEPAGFLGAPVTTTYGYDEGNRLASVSMFDGTTTQQRLFTYDNRGLLTSERHPEKGASGNGAVTYGDYDARGHVGRKTDGTNDLRFVYDRAERLTTVSSYTSGRLEKEFVYAATNGAPADYRLGKLQRATRHNHLSAFSNADVAIGEVYTYGGVGGRVSQRALERTDFNSSGGVINPTTTFFTQAFSWTELGDPLGLTYPSCVIPTECTPGNPSSQPSRTVTHTYTNGFLTGLTGYATIGYHPNEMLASILHTNGVTDTWGLDPDAMRRPARIQTTGVTGGSNFDTGTYAYDGAGNITAMGPDGFSYDGVSRLVTGTAFQGQVSESNQYDAFGNRLHAVTSTVGARAIATDPATNRLLGGGRPVSYDDRGNVTLWGTAGYAYDPFDLMARQDDSGLSLSYVYTADDERILTIDNTVPNETWTARDLDGKVLRSFFRLGGGSPGDTTWLKDTVHRQGQVLATHTGAGRRDAHPDHLGTIRLWTGTGGGTPSHHTYHAFGEEVLDNQDGQALRFTGHERDVYRSGGCSGTTAVNNQTLSTGQTITGCDAVSSENTTITSAAEVRFVAGERIELGEGFSVANGAAFAAEIDGYLNSDLQDLDYMHARYCSPGMGRFLSLDLLGGHPRHPQSWNRYAYVLNNPLKYIDPFGLAVECMVRGGSGDDGEEGDEEIVCTESEGVDVIEQAAKEPNPFTGVQGLEDLIAGSLISTLELGDPLAPVGPGTGADEPIEFTGCSVFDSAGRCLAKCTADEFGLVLVGSGITASSLRLVPTRAKLGGAARGTSIASLAMRKIFPQRLGRSFLTPSLKAGNRTGVLGGLLGRVAGPVGAGMLGASGINIAGCASR